MIATITTIAVRNHGRANNDAVIGVHKIQWSTKMPLSLKAAPRFGQRLVS